MPRPRQNGFNPLTASALVGLAGLGATLGALPELARLPDPWGALPLAAIGLAAWLRHRRDHRMAARLRDLRITLHPVSAPAGPRVGDLCFRPAAGDWRARHQGWQVELQRCPAGWRISLTRLDSPDPALPLASAASADAVLQLARRLLPGLGQPALPDLLDRDLAFPLGGPADGTLLALAEGGYALQTASGECAVTPDRAEILLGRGRVVVTGG